MGHHIFNILAFKCDLEIVDCVNCEGSMMFIALKSVRTTM